MEVQLHANVCYGPDDPTLWSQPWVEIFCHLGAIPRKPDNANDPLSIMWWDPTHNNFKSFGSSLVDRLCQLSGSRLLVLQTIMSNIEDKIKQHKQTSPSPNKLLLLLTKAMQDAFVHLHLLNTMFTEMRIGVTKF